MKVILSIGGHDWISPTAAHAAKISDLLGECQPVQRVWDAGHEPVVFWQKRESRHEVAIKELTGEEIVTPSLDRVNELVKQHKAGVIEAVKQRNPKTA